MNYDKNAAMQHERPLTPEVTYERDVKRILSDTALVWAGAVFENNMLVIPQAQVEQIAREDPHAEQIIPDGLRIDDVVLPKRHLTSNILQRLQEARGILRIAYRTRRLEETVRQFDPNQPAKYIQVVRDYIRHSDSDEAQSTEYSIGDSGATSYVRSDEDLIQRDVTRLLPHRRGLRLYYDRWFDMLAGGWQYSGVLTESPAEDGFINHALALYGITARLEYHAWHWGLELPDQPFSLQELPTPQRMAILETALAEWHEFVGMVSDQALLSKMRQRKPLLYRSVDELRAAYAEYPQFGPDRINRHFMTHPRSFHRTLAELAERAQARVDRQPEGPVLTAREQDMRAQARHALSGENPHQFSEQLAPGEIIRLEDPGQVDDVVFATLARMDANASQLYSEPTGNVWRSQTTKRSAAERLRPRSFIGRLENPCVVILPIDDEYVDKYVRITDDSERIDRESMVRLNVVADMRYTGKGIRGQTVLDVVLYTRDITDPGMRSHVLSIRGLSSGEKVSEYVNALSGENAMHILATAMRHPLHGGRVSPR